MSLLGGKQAMVWKLRDWCGGIPAAQVAEAQRLGLSVVNIKIQNGSLQYWEGLIARQNWHLMAATVRALVDAGIAVKGWAWLYGRNPDSEGKLVDVDISVLEARATIDLTRKLQDLGGSAEHDEDAEAPYKEAEPERVGMAGCADRYFDHLEANAPDITLVLCTYRYPNSHETFPWARFIAGVDGNSQQVYWLYESDVAAGARNLQASLAQYDARRPMATVPIAPTYAASGGWRATPAQLAAFYAAAKGDARCVGASVWCLDLASAEQKDAWAACGPWRDDPVPPVGPPSIDDVRAMHAPGAPGHP